MLLHPAEPATPTLELTALLTRPGERHVTIHNGLDNAHHECVVRRNGQSATVPQDTRRTNRMLSAMLAPESDGWTINGVPARLVKPPLPEVRITLSVQTPTGWRTAVLNGEPDLLPNCRIDGILTSLPGLEKLPRTHLCQLPSDYRHWSPTGKVTLQPMPRFTAGELEMDSPTTPSKEQVAQTVATRLQELRPTAERQLANARHHPLTPPPAKERIWLKAEIGKPRETTGKPDHAAPIIVHGIPVSLRHDARLTPAERASILVTLETADAKFVPVAALCQTKPDGTMQAHTLADGAAPSTRQLAARIQGQELILSQNGRRELNVGMSLIAHGYYRPERHPPMSATLHQDFKPNHDRLTDMLIRCYRRDLQGQIAELANDAWTCSEQAITMAQHAWETAHRLLAQRQAGQIR